METRRLLILLELARSGSMREVAERLQISTSTVSQQIAAPALEAGTPLIEPVSRRVRLTPAGRRLAARAVQIVAAVDAAYADLDPDAEPEGTVRVAGFASALLRNLLPIIDDLAVEHPQVRVVLIEAELDEARSLLANDSIDLALIYDYTLAPAGTDTGLTVLPLWGSGPEPGRAYLFRDLFNTPQPIRSRGFRGLSRQRMDRELSQHGR